jgi:hypothetical protein
VTLFQRTKDLHEGAGEKGSLSGKAITRPSRTFAADKAANEDDPYMSHGAEMRIVSMTAPMRTPQKSWA